MPNKTEAATADKTPKGITTKHIVLILGALIIICAAVVAVILLTRPSADIGEAPTPGGNLVIDESNIESIEAEINERVAKGMFETHMNTTWSFPNGSSASTDAVMGNSASNNYPFWFDVNLQDTNETVYTSSLIPVGMNIKEIVLTKDLDPGSYPAIIQIHMVDENNEPIESNMGFSVTLIVKN
jgi:hypothetical protein